MYQIGQIVHYDGTGYFRDGIDCEVLEVTPDGSRITKMKALKPDEKLGKLGFLKEGEDWVAIEWKWSNN